jgi:late competence protein required for DNA uptake (superfamily II DNA/RNA helicase)
MLDIHQHINPQAKVVVKVSNWTKGVELCNRTACQTDVRVSFWNATMGAWYCVKCARLINDNGGELCKLDPDRHYYEKNIKHQQNISWNEYQTAKEIFEF